MFSTTPRASTTQRNGNTEANGAVGCGQDDSARGTQLDYFFVPEPGSPVIAAGDDSICTSPAVGAKDVFGAHRPQSRHCSIGAVEGNITIPPRLRARARQEHFRFP